MADNTTIAPASNGDRAFHKFIKSTVHTTTNGIKKRMWLCSGAPTVDAGSQATYPIKLGDFLYDYTNSAGYVCTVAPAAGAAGTFVKVVP
jgi:hypothetical protein